MNISVVLDRIVVASVINAVQFSNNLSVIDCNIVRISAPLLCAGAIGYRALRLANLRNGDRLGLTGFGGSAHLVLQLVRHRFPDTQVYVFARDAAVR